MRRRGFSLIEMLVVAALFALLFTILYQNLLPGLKAFRDGDTKAELQQNGLVAISRISRELRLSAVASLLIQSQSYAFSPTETFENDSISFLSPVDANGNVLVDSNTGQLMWQKVETIYLNTTTGSLMYQEQFFTPPTISPDPIVQTSISSALPTDRILARHILGLTVTAPAASATANVPSNLMNPVTIHLHLRDLAFDADQETSVSTLHSATGCRDIWSRLALDALETVK